MRDIKSFSSAAFFIATAFLAFSCQMDEQEMDEQIEEVQKEKIIFEETVFKFLINHHEQDISSKSGTDLTWEWQLENQTVPAFIAFPQRPTITKDNIPVPWGTHGNPLNVVEPHIYSKD